MNPHDWQPIEAAPHNGTPIVGWRADAGIVMIRFGCPADFLPVDELERLEPDEYATAWQEDWFSLDVLGGYRLEGDEVPTHFFLPEEPQEAR